MDESISLQKELQHLSNYEEEKDLEKIIEEKDEVITKMQSIIRTLIQERYTRLHQYMGTSNVEHQSKHGQPIDVGFPRDELPIPIPPDKKWDARAFKSLPLEEKVAKYLKNNFANMPITQSYFSQYGSGLYKYLQRHQKLHLIPSLAQLQTRILEEIQYDADKLDPFLWDILLK